MDEVNKVSSHFCDMARGKIGYSKHFKVIRNVPIPPPQKNIKKPLITAISPAQAANEQTESAVRNEPTVKKTYKKRKSAKRGRKKRAEAF